MPRPHSLTLLQSNYRPWNSAWFRLAVSLTFCISVSLIIRYGYFGDREMVLGPNSSRLFKINPFFVEKIRANSEARSEVRLFGLSQKPELSLETNWSFSRYLFLGPYRNQGFSLWLNTGSSFQVTWEVYPRRSILLTVTKGENGFKTPQLYSIGAETPHVRILSTGDESKKGSAEFFVKEDDSYRVSFTNLNPGVVTVEMRINLTSKMYVTNGATTNCSSLYGVCNLKLLLPDTNYVVILSTSHNDGNGFWHVKLSFLGRVVAYVFILGFLVTIANLLLKLLEVFTRERSDEDYETQAQTATERDSLLANKEVPQWYGAIDEKDSEPLHDSCRSSGSSSHDCIYDGKICSICYDEDRNCFFIPCGHCATCCTCAQRIVNGENRVCPICRRLVHKVKRLF